MDQRTKGRSPEKSIFAAIGRWSYRYRGLVLALWVGLLVLGGVFAPRLDSVLHGTGTTYEAGAAATDRILEDRLGIDPNALTLVFEYDGSRPANVQPLTNEIGALPAVESVGPVAAAPGTTTDGNLVDYRSLSLDGEGSSTNAAIADVLTLLDAETPAGVTSYLAGKSVVDYEAQVISKKDLVRAEALSLPLTLVALVFIFGSVVAALLPVAMAIATVTVTMGLIYAIAQFSDVSIFAVTLTTMLGLGVGIDFTLVMVSRFREELAHRTVPEAVAETMATAGEAVFYSGLTTCIGLLSLLLFPVVLLRSLGIAGSLVILISVLAALTLVPALLGVLGLQINRWRLFTPRENSGFWSWFPRWVIRYRLLAVAAVVAIVVTLTSPFWSAQWGVGDVRVLPATAQARQGVEVLEDAFGVGRTTPILLAVTTETGSSVLVPDAVEVLYNWVASLEGDDRVASVQSLFNLDPSLDLAAYQQLYRAPDRIPLPPVAASVAQLSNGDTTLISVTSATDSNDPQSRELVRELRRQRLPGLSVSVGGETAKSLDTIDVIGQLAPWAIAAIFLVTFISLTLLFGSVVMPLKAIFLNIMSIGASFGALVFIFQQGHFQNLLGFTPVGYLDILLPIVLFCVLFGLSMDYEVFLLARIKEAYDSTGNNTDSIIEGLECTGSIITSSALLTIIVTASFAFTSIIFVKALGLGIAIAVFIDSTLIRAVLVPASMRLMGHWNWWSPTWKKRSFSS
ncbi:MULTISPECIES: MMPL family transporter [Cyanophyceae]|uniref:MMPL family transporter n=1 Tax=Cyanophyceae TaxID=3028117 RepID=UPI00168A0522|nr:MULTISPECIES: MMPL family transporter [unclassified Phormidium]MBD1916146.1 MMPL family transporter [Phormidium sp. FACHB-77]MBD2031585.1 MMPL family transporter [Phormidium sp. FACHB-322]MBD2052788.1 MMPL family transporter [Leptolyngbya sp. FACHB-60]